MKLKTLIAVAVAGAFAMPLAAQSVDNDRMILAQAGGSAGGSGGGSAGTGGASGAAAAQGAQGDAGGAQGAAGGTTTGGNPAGGPGAGVPPSDITQRDQVHPQARGAMGVRGFDELDANRDGMISRQEWDSGSAATGSTTR
ncbi:MAG TPA: hypothetical protein VFC18_00965 [Burkholderiales bacterium]|nr:hypothetical protein [Burkholderiales bacterium]